MPTLCRLQTPCLACIKELDGRADMAFYWILKDKTPTKIEDVLEWGIWFEKAENRRVAFDKIGEAEISTVFLGLDHGFSDDRPPVLFETMVFGGEFDGEQERYYTWEQAEEGHKKWVERVLCSKPV